MLPDDLAHSKTMSEHLALLSPPPIIIRTHIAALRMLPRRLAAWPLLRQESSELLSVPPRSAAAPRSSVDL